MLVKILNVIGVGVLITVIASASLHAQVSTSFPSDSSGEGPAIRHALETPAEREAKNPPLKGYSARNTGVFGDSDSGIGVEGFTSSARSPAASFRNWSDSGDHLQAGQPLKNTGPVFRVTHNGDVLVRGRLIGQKGDTGPEGKQGPEGKRGPEGKQGPPGPGGKSIAICGIMATCNCNTGSLVTGSHAPCVVTADTGSCKGEGPQTYCCVCKI